MYSKVIYNTYTKSYNYICYPKNENTTYIVVISTNW